MNSTKATGVQSLDDELSSTTSTSAIDIVNVRRPSRGTSRQDTMDVSAQSDLSSYQSPSAFKILGDPLIWLSSPLKHEQVVTSKVRATSHTAGDPWLNGDTYAWGTRFIHEGECGGVKLWHGEGTDLRLLHNLLAEQDVTQTVWCAHDLPLSRCRVVSQEGLEEAIPAKWIAKTIKGLTLPIWNSMDEEDDEDEVLLRQRLSSPPAIPSRENRGELSQGQGLTTLDSGLRLDAGESPSGDEFTPSAMDSLVPVLATAIRSTEGDRSILHSIGEPFFDIVARREKAEEADESGSSSAQSSDSPLVIRRAIWSSTGQGSLTMHQSPKTSSLVSGPSLTDASTDDDVDIEGLDSPLVRFAHRLPDSPV